MKIRDSFVAVIVVSLAVSLLADEPELLPIVPDGFVVDVVAKEPMVTNPCVMAFDRMGRLCIAHGSQWRSPTPESVGDRVVILIDEDGDGIADRKQVFAKGFNSIQGLAWKDNDLWVANAPDLTVVRDTDGDDEADDYIKVYTGLGNLEHSLHGLNFGPDGKLYMSKGNSRGYNRLDQLAPKAFRELWGLQSPEGAPDYTAVEHFTPETYKRSYHTPADDWGQQGGILRCQPYDSEGKISGRNLEIVSRGFRNPWDIAFDDSFNWLGTDNDQTSGDRIFAPFYGAHFGWGHPWSFHWTGKDHLPTVPNSALLFEGSGTGVAHYHAAQFPPEYRDLFFVGDWLRREVLMFRPRWEGALMVAETEAFDVFAHADGGRTLPASDGCVFDPTDIEVGPDGALYVLSWGHGYGGTVKNGQQIDEGRVYRIRFAGNPLQKWQSQYRSKPLSEWTMNDLLSDLGSNVAAWRVSAQEEFIRRGPASAEFLQHQLSESNTLSRSTKTWAIWTLSRLVEVDVLLEAGGDDDTQIQIVRAASQQLRTNGTQDSPQFQQRLIGMLASNQPRQRFEAIQAIGQSKVVSLSSNILELMNGEPDRITFYAAWNVIRDLVETEQRIALLHKSTGQTTTGLLLGLLADDAVSTDDVHALMINGDSQEAAVAENWLVNTGALRPLVELSPEPGEFTDLVSVSLKANSDKHRLTYTTDGSNPSGTSPQYRDPITIDKTTLLKVAVLEGKSPVGRIVTAEYRIVPPPEYAGQQFIRNVSTPSGRRYEMDYQGLAVGKPVYTDRDYAVQSVPAELAYASYLRVANADDRSMGDTWLSFESDVDVDVLVGVDTRNETALSWMKVDQKNGFATTNFVVPTDDADFRFYRKHFHPGGVVLGGNTNEPTDSGRGNYIVVFNRKLLTPSNQPATAAQVVAAMKTADISRGKELFMHRAGAGCVKCHGMDSAGKLVAPDLSDLGNRAKKPDAVIQSILDPGAVITEGFAQQQIVTIEGKIVSGAVIEETGLSLKLVGTDGIVKTVRKAEIEERIGTKLSPMPAGFGKLMSAQQVADITAWLMTRKIIGDRKGFSFRDHTDSIDIYLSGQRIATYLKKHPRLTRRGLINVTTASGIPVTRRFPPKDGEDHPMMHPGIWISFGDLDGNDYWRLKSKVLFDGFVEPPTGTQDTGRFSVRNKYLSEDGQQVICVEQTTYQFRKVLHGISLQLEAEYRSGERDFYFGDQEESGLGVRVASKIRVNGGNGTILNSRGQRNGKQIWGNQADWFDYSGTIDGRHVGLLVASSANNSRPSWLHARDYGVVVTNPFPKQPKERKEPYVRTVVKAKDTFRLSYTILIHESDIGEEFDPSAAAEAISVP